MYAYKQIRWWVANEQAMPSYQKGEAVNQGDADLFVKAVYGRVERQLEPGFVCDAEIGDNMGRLGAGGDVLCYVSAERPLARVARQKSSGPSLQLTSTRPNRKSLPTRFPQPRGPPCRPAILITFHVSPRPATTTVLVLALVLVHHRQAPAAFPR